jgi:hypothetical protein
MAILSKPGSRHPTPDYVLNSEGTFPNSGVLFCVSDVADGAATFRVGEGLTSPSKLPGDAMGVVRPLNVRLLGEENDEGRDDPPRMYKFGIDGRDGMETIRLPLVWVDAPPFCLPRFAPVRC